MDQEGTLEMQGEPQMNKIVLMKLLIFIVVFMSFIGFASAYIPDTKGVKLANKYYIELTNKGKIHSLVKDQKSQVFDVGVGATRNIFFQKGIIHVNIYLSKKLNSYEKVVDFCKICKTKLKIDRRVKIAFFEGTRENRVKIHSVNLKAK